MNDSAIISEATSLDTPKSVKQFYPFEDVEIEDVAVFSKSLLVTESKAINIGTFVSQFDIDAYYNGPIPFNTTSSIPPNTYSNKMWHPLQSRKVIPPPQIAILGVPEDW